MVADTWVWRRDRPRAIITHVGEIIGNKAVGDWRWHIGEERPVPLALDPLNGEEVHWGWSVSELREVLKQPAEFVQPEVLH